MEFFKKVYFKDIEEIKDFIETTVIIDIILVKDDSVVDTCFYEKKDPYKLYMDKIFFQKYKEFFTNLLYESNKYETSLVVNEVMFTDEIFKKALSGEHDIITFSNVELTPEQLTACEKSNLNIFLAKGFEIKTISTTKELPKEIKESIYFSESDDEEYFIDELNGLEGKTKINFFHNALGQMYIEESRYLNKAVRLLHLMKQNGYTQNFNIIVFDKAIFNSKIDEFSQFTNVLVTVNSETLTLEEYIGLELTLESMIINIKNSSDTPFEKFLRVYNIVKNYKDYKEDETDLKNARQLSRIVKNDFIVCTGFASLLIDLLKRVGIESIKYSCFVDDRTDESAEDEKTIEHHAKVLVNITDEKYKLDGYFISDPTWDNSLTGENTYNHVIRGMESMRRSSEYLYSLTDIDLFLDVDSYDDFINKTNYYLERKLRETLYFDTDSIDRKKEIKIDALIETLEFILGTLKTLDNYIFSDVYPRFIIARETRNYELLESTLKLIGKYILSKTNNHISYRKLSDAIIKVDGREDTFWEKACTFNNLVGFTKENFPYDKDWNNRIDKTL